MAAATVVPSAIVLQVLNQHNYEDWSVQVKTYLMAEDLWDVVKATSIEAPPKLEDFGGEAEFKTWEKNNAKALHTIQISCGPETFSLIRDKTTAKIAWDTLAAKFMPGLLNTPGEIVETPQKDLKTEEQRTAVNPNNAVYDSREYQPFFHAVRCGDWNYAREFITRHPNAIKARVPDFGRTALHIATDGGHVHIVEELVQLMSEEDLEIKDVDGKTPLGIASMRGITKMAECMVTKHNKLLSIADNYKMIPVVVASVYDNWDMVRYLYFVTPLEDLIQEKSSNGAQLICQSLYSKTFDIAWDLLRRYPSLILSRNHYGLSPVYALTEVSFAFPSQTPLKFCQQWIYKCIYVEPTGSINDFRVNVQNLENEQGNSRDIIFSGPRFLKGLVSKFLELLGIKKIYEMKLIHAQVQEVLDLMCNEIKYLSVTEMRDSGINHATFHAIELGIFEFVINIFKANPDLVLEVNNMGRGPFMFAIECRQEKVYNLIYGLHNRNVISAFSDNYGNTMLHIAGMLSPSAKLNRISGAALQMQRELQWFKEVETIVPRMFSEYANKDHVTSHMLFIKSHKELKNDGEKWMKETATSCTVVGALIITMMFAAAFTVPGGNDGETGYPIFLRTHLLSVYITSDATALFSSTTSVLMFLGILTSRYAENDFLISLPTKMIIGLSTLFISIASMTVAFCSALLIIFHEKTWIIIPTIFLASVPVILFVRLQFPLLVEIFISTYGGGIFDKKVKPWL